MSIHFKIQYKVLIIEHLWVEKQPLPRSASLINEEKEKRTYNKENEKARFLIAASFLRKFCANEQKNC